MWSEMDNMGYSRSQVRSQYIFQKTCKRALTVFSGKLVRIIISLIKWSYVIVDVRPYYTALTRYVCTLKVGEFLTIRVHPYVLGCRHARHSETE